MKEVARALVGIAFEVGVLVSCLAATIFVAWAILDWVLN